MHTKASKGCFSDRLMGHFSDGSFGRCDALGEDRIGRSFGVWVVPQVQSNAYALCAGVTLHRRRTQWPFALLPYWTKKTLRMAIVDASVQYGNGPPYYCPIGKMGCLIGKRAFPRCFESNEAKGPIWQPIGQQPAILEESVYINGCRLLPSPIWQYGNTPLHVRVGAAAISQWQVLSEN